MKSHTLRELLLSCVIFLLVGIEMNSPVAAQQKSVPVPTPQPGTSKPASSTGADEADLFWRSRQKYFLVVAASKTAGVGNDLPFTKVDGQLISQTFVEKGYEKLDMLDDKRATRDNYVKQLQRIRSLPENAVVVVYYSGHAVKDPQEKDLWLQLYGQADFGDHYGLSLSELIGAARGNTYKGDLVIILDSCYSGQGTLTSQLSLRETDKTIIFSSSATYQPSYSVKLPSGREISAFTYFLLQGMGPDWAEVDGDSDGIILYSDLQTYIENKLLELLHAEAILGPMQPQLFGQTPKIWVAYDPAKVRNFETQQRKTLRLQRLFQVQDPEKMMEMLNGPLPANAHAYLRALQALKKDQFDEAWRLLEKAEEEKKVPLAEIYWARAGVKAELGELGSARDWCEKALAASPQQNVDLIEMTAFMNFALGNWTRSEELLKNVLELIGEQPADKEDEILSLYTLAMLNVFQGDKLEAELYLRRLKNIDVKVLEEQEEGLSNIIPFLEVLSDIIQGKTEKARREIDDLRQSVASTKGELQQTLRSLIQMMYTVVNERDAGTPNTTIFSTDRLREWDEFLQNKDANSIILLLNQILIAVSSSTAPNSLRSPQVESLLKRTVDFARQHVSEKQRLTVQTPTVTRQVEIAGTEKQSLIESANLLTAAATIYAAWQEMTEAEKLYREAIALGQEEKQGTALTFNPVVGLGRLYEGAGRFNDAENLYKNYLVKLRDQLGEKHAYAYIIYENLGWLYEQQERWAEAEQSYRTVAGLSQPGLDSENIMTIDGREKLASFLFERGRFEEAAKLFEQLIEWAERNKQTKPLLVESSLGDDYFKLAKSYYQLQRYESAETAFQKTADNFSSREEPDLIDNLSCLVWQWFTSRALKKTDEGKRFYQKVVKVAESDLAQPHPNEDLGSNLQTFASWFRDAQAYAEAEQLLRLALGVQEKAYGSQRPEVAQVWESLADLSDARKQYGNTIDSLKKAQEIYEKQSPLDPDKLSNILYRMGFASYERQEFEQARVQLQKSIDVLQQEPKSSGINNNNGRYMLGRVQQMLGQYAAAKTNLTLVLEADNQAQQREPTAILSDLLELAAISRRQGNIVETDQWLARAQTVIEKIPGEIGTWRARLMYEMGMLSLATGKTKQGEKLLREAIEKGEKDSQMDLLSLAGFMDDYAVVLRQRNKQNEAAQLSQRAKQIRDELRNGGNSQ